MEKIVINYSLLLLLYVNLETLIRTFVDNAVEEQRFCHNIYTRTATSIGTANSNTLIPTAATNARCCPESSLFAGVVKRLKYDKCFYGKGKMRRKHEPTH